MAHPHPPFPLRRPRRCPTGKRTHPSRGAAEAALRSVVKRDDTYRGHVYPCGLCVGWHFGRWTRDRELLEGVTSPHPPASL